MYLNFHNRKNTGNKYKYHFVLWVLQNIQHDWKNVKISGINALPQRPSYFAKYTPRFFLEVSLQHGCVTILTHIYIATTIQ